MARRASGGWNNRSPWRFRRKHWARGTVAVSLGAFSISSIRFLCFHFLSWNKSGMETLCQTRNSERDIGQGPTAGNSQIIPQVVFAFSFLGNQVFRQRLVWPLGKKLQRISQKVIIVTTSTFISSYYGWPLGLINTSYVYSQISPSL